ncbi:MAG TPA: hypothetical protein VJU16_05010 [Planctomycetota bacterium]|nr:hypothetical protein [Planctomycetota bacterium]
MRIAAALLAVLLAGCWTGSGSTAGSQVFIPGVPPIVVVAPDSVSVVPLGPVANGSFEYGWSCSAPQANLTVAGITGGSIRIEIEDDDAVPVHDNVYNGGLVGAISAMTSPDGAPGHWVVRFTFTNVVSVGAIDIEADVFDQPDDITIAGMYSLQSSYEFEAGWPSGPARVNLASAIALGTVRIRMWDGAGDLVMDRTNFAIFIGAFNGDSHSGAAGTWRVRIDINATATAGAITINHP